MRQSCRFILRCLEQIPIGLIKSDGTKLCPPMRQELKWSMEAIINHFKFYTNRVTVPRGEAYVATEAPKT